MMKEIFNLKVLTNENIREQVIGLVRDSLQSIFPACILLKILKVEVLSLKSIIMSIYQGVKKQLLICFLTLLLGENITHAAMCI